MHAIPGLTDAQVRDVLNSWGPGKFDAELILDGRPVNPNTNQPAATLIPSAFGLAGFNNHTWTGEWGTVTYWNAFVGNLEMQGVGRFFDARLNDPTKFPIAAAAGFGNKNSSLSPQDDRITSKLAALQFYQLAIPAPKPQPNIDFDNAAAFRGDALFVGKARCNQCHVKPLWTEPSRNLHKASEIGIDDFQDNRPPNGLTTTGTTLANGFYKTANLAGLYVRENGLFMAPANEGRFYQNGRFATLLDVVDHYNVFFGLNLSAQERATWSST